MSRAPRFTGSELIALLGKAGSLSVRAKHLPA